MKQLSLKRRHKETLVLFAEGRARGEMDTSATKELMEAGYVLDGKLTGLGQQIARDLIQAKTAREIAEKEQGR